MREVGKNKHQAAWAEAMDAKFEGKGEPYGREQFDKILGDFEVNIDDHFLLHMDHEAVFQPG